MFRFIHIGFLYYFFLLFILPLSSAEQDPFYQRFVLHRSAVTACGLRLEGSNEEAQVFTYLKNTLKKYNLHLEELDFSSMRDGHSFSRILSVTIPGKSPNSLFLVIPMSQEMPRSFSVETDPDGISLALCIIEEWAQNPPPASLKILFLGGDTGVGEGIGSRFFLQIFQTTRPPLILYLHLTNIPSVLDIQTGAKGLVSPALPLGLLLKAFESTGIKLFLPESRNQLYRMGVPMSPTPLGPFLRAQIPALGMKGDPYNTEATTNAPITATKDWVQGFKEGFQSFLSQYGSLDFSESPMDWDTHYIPIRWGKKLRLLDETMMVGILLGVLTGSFILSFIRRKQTLRYLNTLLRHFWNLPFLFLLQFLFLSIGTWVLKWIEQLRFPLWEYDPLLHFLVKLSSATFLFSLFFHTLHRLPLAKRGRFYSASSILFFFVNILVFSLLNVALCHYFLWGFLCSLGFSLFRRKRIKLLFLLISPILLFRITYNLFVTPELPMIRVLLFSSTGNILLAFMLLPFILMAIRIDFLLRHPASHKPGWGLRSIVLFSGALTFGLSGYLLSYAPFSIHPIPVQWKETLDVESGTHSLTLSSITYLKEGTYPYGTSRIEIPPHSKKVETYLPRGEDPLRVQVKQTSFLDRTTYHFMFTSNLPPYIMDCTIEASEDTVIYGSNFPITPEVGTRKTKVFIGRNPPQPVSLILTLPRRHPFTVNLTAYSQPHGLPSIGEGYQVVNKVYIVQKSVRIE